MSVVVSLFGTKGLPHTHTCTHTQPFYTSMDFVRDNPGEPVPEEIFTQAILMYRVITIIRAKYDKYHHNNMPHQHFGYSHVKKSVTTLLHKLTFFLIFKVIKVKRVQQFVTRVTATATHMPYGSQRQK